VSLLLTSCDASEELDFYKDVEQPTRIGIQEPLVELNVRGDQVQNVVAILGNYDNWSLEASETWVVLEKGTTEENGKIEDAVLVSAVEYTGYSRTATATVTASYSGETYLKTFEIVQETALEEPEISVLETLLTFAAPGETLEVNIET